eukprot:g4451.t1
MPKFVPSPRCDDPLGIGSWRADDDSSRREKQNTPAVHIPDLGRGNSGEPRPAGPPGSAPPWNENDDGRYLATPSGRGGVGVLFASTRSRNVLHEAWGEVTTEGSNAISKATFILIHVEIHRRVGHAESIAHPTSGSASCDLRSDAEMNWSTSSKGRTVMDFEQFQQACLAMANGLGVTADGSQYGTFCGVVLEACQEVGEHLQVNRPSTRPTREGLSSPSALPPDTPLRGSFPARFDKTTGPDENGRWLLRSARPAEKKCEREEEQEEEGRRAEGPEVRQAGPEQGFGDDDTPRQSKPKRSAEKAATTSGGGPVPLRGRAAVTCGGDKSAAAPATGDAARGGRAVLVMQRADRQSAPAAAAAGRDPRDGDGSTGTIILARGLFAATSPPPSSTAAAAAAAAATGPQSKIRPLDSRLLMGSVSQKALMLQEELRNDRARLLELQRYSSRGQTALLPCGTSPPSSPPPPSPPPPASPPLSPSRDGVTDDKQPDLPRSVTADVGGVGSGGGDVGGQSQHPLPPLASAAPRVAGGHAVTADAAAAAAVAETTAAPPDALSCTAVGYRFSGGSGESERAGECAGSSVDGSLSTGSMSTGADMSEITSRAPKVPPKGKVVLLPCRLCRAMESALWCAECKMSFCALCFAKVPHHQGTGLLLHDAARDPSSRQRGDKHFSGSAAASRRGESTGKRHPDAPPSARHEPPPKQHERDTSTSLPTGGRLRRGRPRSLPFPAGDPAPELAAMEMEGLRTGAKKGSRRKSRRASALLEEKMGRPVSVLPQDELAAFRSIPALCLNSGSGSLCSARDFHNNKYGLAAAKAVSPRGLPLDFSKGKGRYNYCGGSLKGDGNYDNDGRVTGGGVGGAKGVKTFGGTSVRVIVQ